MDAFEMRDDHDLKSALEAMLFVTSDPIETEALSAFLEEDVDRITVALKELQETYHSKIAASSSTSAQEAGSLSRIRATTNCSSSTSFLGINASFRRQRSRRSRSSPTVSRSREMTSLPSAA